MPQFNTGRASTEHSQQHVMQTEAPVYTRDEFRAILARQPEWKIRAALEEGNIPCSNIEHTLEWIEEQDQIHHHRGYWN